MAIFTVGMIETNNMDWLPEYAPKTRELIEKHGGRYVVAGKPERLEGSRTPSTMTVVLEFPDRAALDAWHADPEYLPLLKLRQENATSEIVLVEQMAVSG